MIFILFIRHLKSIWVHLRIFEWKHARFINIGPQRLAKRVSGRFVPWSFRSIKQVVSFHAIVNSFHKTPIVLQSLKVSIGNLEVNLT